MSKTRLSNRTQLYAQRFGVRVFFCGLACLLHGIGHDRSAQFGVRGEHAVEADEVQARAWCRRGRGTSTQHRQWSIFDARWV